MKIILILWPRLHFYRFTKDETGQATQLIIKKEESKARAKRIQQKKSQCRQFSNLLGSVLISTGFMMQGGIP